jgi:hypothetical protein
LVPLEYSVFQTESLGAKFSGESFNKERLEMFDHNLTI